MGVKTRETAVSERVDSLTKVDSCLSELYTRAIEQEGAVPTSKAVLLNLVVYAADAELAKKAAESASEILATLSCRTIIAGLSSTEEPEGASLSLVCGISDRGDKRLCGEVIRLFAPPGSVTGAVMPLLIPDVPVYLWVRGEIPPERDDFADLLRVASHVIVDSRTGSDSARNLRSSERLSMVEGGRRVLHDLAWFSILNWREATARHFDAPAVRHYLEQIAEVTIRYSGSADVAVPDSPPVLFAAWLMERTRIAGSDVFRSRDEGFRIDAKQGGRSVLLRLIPDGLDSGAGELRSVVMVCGDAERSGVFTTEAAGDGQLLLSEDCQDVCLPPKAIGASAVSDAALATAALTSYRRDRVFGRALEGALVLVGQMELADERSARFRL